MGKNVPVSPFLFATYTPDKQSIVVSIPSDPNRYYTLLDIDGIDADDIISYAVAQHEGTAGPEEAIDLGAVFPDVVTAIAAQQHKDLATTFVETKKAKVTLSDIDTCEVEELELEATPETYAKAAATAKTRAEYQAQHQGPKKKKPAPAAAAGADAAVEEDEEEYEDVEDEEDDEEAEEDEEHKALVLRCRKLEMLSTQMEAAIGLANELGASFHQIEKVFIDAQGPGGSLPASAEECQKLAAGNPALERYLQQVQHSLGMDGGAHDHDNDAPGDGMDPRAAAAAAGQQCQQQ